MNWHEKCARRWVSQLRNVRRIEGRGGRAVQRRGKKCSVDASSSSSRISTLMLIYRCRSAASISVHRCLQRCHAACLRPWLYLHLTRSIASLVPLLSHLSQGPRAANCLGAAVGPSKVRFYFLNWQRGEVRSLARQLLGTPETEREGVGWRGKGERGELNCSTCHRRANRCASGSPGHAHHAYHSLA